MEQVGVPDTALPYSPNLSPLILAGPTLTHKSLVARLHYLASGAEVVTADKYYMYAGEHFLLGVGLTPEDMVDNTPKHLYGVLGPQDPLPTPQAYVQMAEQAVNRIHAGGRNALFEGCSYSYTAALIGRFGVNRAMRLTWNTTDWLSLIQTIADAYDRLVALGLHEETERNLTAGFEHTYPMTSLIYRPAIAVVRGTLSAEDASRQTINLWLESAIKTDRLFAHFPGLLPLVPGQSGHF